MASNLADRREQRKRTIGLCLVVLGGLFSAQAIAQLSGWHKVIIVGKTANAGIVRTGTPIKKIIRVVNISALPLDIVAKSSCGCTVADEPTRTVAPLGMTSIKETIDTTGMARGNHERSVNYELCLGETHWNDISVIKYSIN